VVGAAAGVLLATRRRAAAAARPARAGSVAAPSTDNPAAGAATAV